MNRDSASVAPRPSAERSAKEAIVLTYYRCPKCRHLQETLSPDSDHLCECFGCHQHSPAASFSAAKVRRTAMRCRQCSTTVSLTPENLNWGDGISYLCPKCLNRVAVEYGRQFVDPAIVADPAWNTTLGTRGQLIHKGLTFVACHTKKDFLVVRLLQLDAKKEDGSFMFVREEDQAAGLLLDSSRKKYLGFVVWSEADGHAVLRQLYIVPDERRRGLASRLVTFWVDHYAVTVNETFGIESPNRKTLGLLVKAGYAVVEEDSIRCVKCFFVGSL